MTYPPVSSGHHSSKSSAEPQRYLAINDFADALQAFPADIIRQFTLLKEIDAKCINTQPELNHQISKYVKLAEREAPVEQKHSKLGLIKDLLLSNLPCYEEKMTIASLATDLVAKHIDRINNDFELIINHEIPKIVKFGPKNHPAIIPDSKLPENKSAQTQRSESRREAIAAKKAAQNDDATGAVSVSGSSSSGHHSSVGSGSSIAGSSSNASGKSKNGRNHHSSTISNSKGKESTPGASRKKKSSISNGSNNSSFGDRNQHSNLHAASGNGHVTTSSGISHNNDVDYGSSTANSQRYGKSAHSITAGNSSKLATAPALSQASSSGSQNNSRSNSSTAVKTENENSRKRQKVVKKSSSSSSNKIVRKDLGHDNAKSQNSNAALSSTGGNHQDEDFEPEEEDNANDVYCICQQVSFGEMICCDNDKCKIQWFHLQCVGLNSPPTGTWYCDDCKKQSHMR